MAKNLTSEHRKKISQGVKKAQANKKTQAGKTAKKTEALTSAIVSRAKLAQKLGQSFGGDRDLYDAVGYPKNLTFERFSGRYERQDIAKRIITAYPEATWKSPPLIYETIDKTATKFEKDLEEIIKRNRIYYHFNRADKLVGLGEFAVVLLGFDDNEDLSQPVGNASELLYMQPYSQDHAEIFLKETNPKDKRYGLPVIYKIRPDTGVEIKVHQTRICHIAENCDESEVYGTPRLEAVYNRLQDIETMLAGSSESFWSSGFPGMSLEAEPGANIQDEDALQDEIDEYVNNVRRYMRLQGLKVQELGGKTVDPSPLIKTELQLISGATGIPLRILLGSEEGKLASEQDQNNWSNRVQERKEQFASPAILKPFIDRLIEVGVLSEPKEGYTIDWGVAKNIGEKEQATIARTKAEAIAAYAKTPGVEDIIPPKQFLEKIMGMDADEVEEILTDIEKGFQEEDFDIEEEKEV